MGVRGNLQKTSPKKNPFSDQNASGTAVSDFIIVCLLSFLVFLLSITFKISRTLFEALGLHYHTHLFYIDDLIFPTFPILVFSLTWYAWRRYKSIQQSDISLELFQKLVDQSTDLIFVVDPQTSRILDVNEGVCRNLGYTRKTLLKKKIIEIEETLTTKKLWEGHIKEIRKNKNQLSIEGVKKRKDGTKFPVEINIRLIKEGDDEYIIAVARDITKRKQNTEKLLESYKHVGVINRKIEVLSNLIKFKVKNREKTIQYILSTALNFSRRDYGMFYAYEKDSFVLLDQKGLLEKSVSKIKKLSPADCPVTKKLLETQKLVFEKRAKGRKWPLDQVMSVLALPLMSHGKIIGMILLGSEKKDIASDYSLDFYDVFAVQISRMYARMLEKKL